MSVKFGEKIKVLPVLGAVDLGGTETATAFVDLDLAQWVTFVANFGACSSAGATCDDVLIEVAASSIQTTAGFDYINFAYRLSSAVGTDSMSAITTGTSDGITIGPALDNKTLIVDVDPSVVAAKSSIYRFVALNLTPASTQNIVSVTAFIEPRYPGNSIPSST